jgi:hypothetical protein
MRLLEIHAQSMRTPFAPRSRGDAISMLKRRIDHHYWPRWSAPTSLAQLMLDAGTASLLAVYARPAHRESWWSTASWQTFPKFLSLAVLMMIAGYLLDWFDPTAITLFDVLANR